MNTHARTMAFGLTLMAGVALASGDAAASFPCNDRTIQGTYGTNLTGFVSPDGVTQVPLTQVGLFQLDGQGSLTGTDTASIGGQILEREFNGTYEVDPDCTLTVVVTNLADGVVTHVSGVVLGRGNASLLISTDPFTTFSGRAERVGPR